MSNKLNLGSGDIWKSYPAYEGLDIIDFGQKYVGNALEMLTNDTFTEGQWEEVMANHFLEHFSQDELKIIFSNVHRILKEKGRFRFVVPHKKREEAWVLSHKTFWSEATVRWLERADAETTYGFGHWKIVELIVNERGDIHAVLEKI